jgi:hypothetical protein
MTTSQRLAEERRLLELYELDRTMDRRAGRRLMVTDTMLENRRACVRSAALDHFLGIDPIDAFLEPDAVDEFLDADPVDEFLTV